MILSIFGLILFNVTVTDAQTGIPGLMATPINATSFGTPGDWWADVVIGQPDFSQITPNQVVGNKLFNPGGVYVDRSVTPNRMYVYNAGNSCILGLSSLGACGAGFAGADPSTA